jgi:protoporphyrinogen oxidase
VIIGAGPAGLTAAYELSKLGIPAAVFEADSIVGGISRTETYKGFRFDIGGHRFFTKVEIVEELWHEILTDGFLLRPRLSRIFYAGKFFDYPLKPVQALLGLGIVESIRIGLSYAYAQLFPSHEERSFDQWVSNRFGRRLFEIFFKTYTEKVWGMPCHEISADWAAQRIKNLNLVAAVKHALLGARGQGGQVVTTLIEEFQYPRLGPGMMWERCRDLLEQKGYAVTLGARVVRIRHADERITSLVLRGADGREWEERGTHFISSMPIRELVEALDPPAPEEVPAAAARLRYRDFLTVVLIVDEPDLFPDNWIYVHSPEVRLGRIQNFKNWSPEMVPDPAKSSLGLEYFVQEGDEVWAMPDDELIALGQRECAALGLLDPAKVSDGCVLRMRKAYPVYDGDYQDAIAVIRAYLAKFPNLQLVGRNGQHRYNNQDHSMLTAVYAARNLVGAAHDVWEVNVEPDYHEEVRSKRPGDRAVPEEALDSVGEELIASLFAKYDAVALGGALAILFGGGGFLATALLLLQGGEVIGPTLALLNNYFLGFFVSWSGALLLLVEAGAFGFVFGFTLAKLINATVRWHELAFRRRIELLRLLSGPD